MKAASGLRTFASLALTGYAVQFLTLLSGPLVARMLGPEGRGQVALMMVMGTLCAVLGIGGLPTAVSHVVAGAGNRPARDVVGPHLRHWMSLMAVPALAACVGTWIVIGDHGDRLGFAGLAALMCLGYAANFILGAMLLGEGAVRSVNLQRIIGMVSYVSVIAVLFLAGDQYGAVVIIVVFVVSQLVGVAVGWRLLRRPVGGPAAARPEIRKLARQGWVSGLKAMDGFNLDQLVVGIVIGQVALGLYAVAASITSVTVIALAGVAQALLPRMSAQTPDAAVRTLRRWVGLAVALLVVTVVAVELVLEPALRLAFGREFLPALDAARILAPAWALLALRRVLTAGAQAQGRVTATSVAEAVGTGLLVVGAVVGAHVGGLEGAAVAVFIAAALTCGSIATCIRWRTTDVSG